MTLNPMLALAINPQPLPPSHGASRFDQVALNPQPLPPGEGGRHGSTLFSDEPPRCGNEPRHFPPLPVPVGPWGDLMRQLGL